MLQTMRTRHMWLTRNLVALWFVLFFACSFAHADTRSAQTNAASHADALLTSPCHGQHDLGGASSDTCNALQNSPRNQQLSIGLDLAVLLGLVATFTPLAGLRRPLQFIWPRLHSPGWPTPIRKQLHRYNE
jgi:hypothetical protein